MPKTTTALGKEFELYVASLYEALGFKVERNLNIKGHQVDLLIRRAIAGFGVIQSIIECKYLTVGTVSNQAVHDFAHYVARVRESIGISGGVMITNRDYSTDAKLAMNSEHFIHLKDKATWRTSYLK
jgi:Restriction endonuclease